LDPSTDDRVATLESRIGLILADLTNCIFGFAFKLDVAWSRGRMPGPEQPTTESTEYTDKH